MATEVKATKKSLRTLRRRLGFVESRDGGSYDNQEVAALKHAISLLEKHLEEVEGGDAEQSR